MKIRNLIENTQGENNCTPQHGLSFYIETKKHRILSDFGPGEEMLSNAKKLGVDLKQVEIAVLSHGHYDHSGGLPAFAEMNPDASIYIHNRADRPYYSFDGKEKGYRYIGIDPAIMELQQVTCVSGDYVIDDELSVFSNLTDCMKGQRQAGKMRSIPATNRYLMVKEGDAYTRDDFLHEQCLVIREACSPESSREETCSSESSREEACSPESNREEACSSESGGQASGTPACGKNVLISGCAHSGILNILDRYEEIYRSLPDVVISGFHLMKKKDYTQEECEEIRAIGQELTSYPTRFYTCHCTGLPAYDMLKEIMGDQLSYVHCGDEIIV